MNECDSKAIPVVFIPGTGISIFTFPGVIFHELIHPLSCHLFGVAIFDVYRFTFGSPAGYGVHEHPAKTGQQIWVGLGPFIANEVVSGTISAPTLIQVLQFDADSPWAAFLIWLSVRIDAGN